ncbi:MAG: hypothetical protein ACE5Q3_12085 [Alphaproteobacteria bacterium]
MWQPAARVWTAPIRRMSVVFTVLLLVGCASDPPVEAGRPDWCDQTGWKTSETCKNWGSDIFATESD